MKKVALLVTVLFVPLLLLTGCGKKQTLTCTQNIMGIADMEISLYYSGGKPTGGQYKYTIDYTISGESTVQEEKKKDQCADFTKSLGSKDADKYVKKCTEKWDGNKLIITVSLNKSIADEEGYDKIDTAKEKLEKNSYTCEIK